MVVVTITAVGLSFFSLSCSAAVATASDLVTTAAVAAAAEIIAAAS